MLKFTVKINEQLYSTILVDRFYSWPSIQQREEVTWLIKGMKRYCVTISLHTFCASTYFGVGKKKRHICKKSWPIVFYLIYTNDDKYWVDGMYKKMTDISRQRECGRCKNLETRHIPTHTSEIWHFIFIRGARRVWILNSPNCATKTDWATQSVPMHLVWQSKYSDAKL